MGTTEERPKRRYVSPTREAALAATHRRIIEAAAELFARDGYRSTTLAAIAEKAGVSVPRVNLSGSKPALLVEAYEERAGGSGARVPVTEQSVLQQIMALDTEEALDAYVEWLAEAHAGSIGLWQALSEAATSDEDAATELTAALRRNDEAARAGVAWADSRGLLQGDVSHEERAQVWALLGSAETYGRLAKEYGWSHERYAAWVRRSLVVLVFDLA
ncbi:helix-turn-helix domain-containing protein [Nocardioides zeae]|uniref:Helix-turn-helix domain-containing protein n=1 Tax=Nocardioides imazamoxiresistens TaxID=3231893 RepID=A0ABU3PSQ8_9ACTN|nr:helix-turn-helix domain-containing protein [Nocardioides zeae]MDT9592263.1 helix-turn-helix domain-containing protein [Nocardioides zeae]